MSGGGAAAPEELASAVLEAVGAAPTVLVEGSGPLADALRGRLGPRLVAAGAPVVHAAVDCSATAAGVAAACAAVADLGTVVLAATPAAGGLDLDLYQDVHRRGVRLVGVPDPALPAG